LELDEITGAVVDESVRIHRGLGPSLFESVYEVVLASALERRGLRVARQHPISFSFDGIHFDQGFRADLLVQGCVIVELKSIERFAPVHTTQLLTYLRLSNLQVGLLLNFGAGTMKEGIKRVVNDLPLSASPRLRVNQRAIAPRDGSLPHG
jgi:iron complex transport system substrate-binding protein